MSLLQSQDREAELAGSTCAGHRLAPIIHAVAPTCQARVDRMRLRIRMANIPCASTNRRPSFLSRGGCRCREHGCRLRLYRRPLEKPWVHFAPEAHRIREREVPEVVGCDHTVLDEL